MEELRMSLKEAERPSMIQQVDEGIAKLASSSKSPFSAALQLQIRALLYQVCAQMWN